MYTIDENKKITIVKKDTAYISVVLPNYDLKEGDTLTFTIAREKESQEPLVQKVTTDFATDHIAVFYFSSQDTNLDKGTYYYDIQLNTSDGWVDTVIGPAKIKVIEGVTY